MREYMKESLEADMEKNSIYGNFSDKVRFYMALLTLNI